MRRFLASIAIALTATTVTAVPLAAPAAAANCSVRNDVRPDVEILNPSNRASFSAADAPKVRVRAFDRNVGTSNSAGIAGVSLKVKNMTTGQFVYAKIDRAAPYEFNLQLPAGTYRIGAIAKSVCAAGGNRNGDVVGIRVAPNISPAEQRSVVLLNRQRSAAGLRTLTVDERMSGYARNWSSTMSASGFRHSGGPWAENIAWVGGSSLSAGEAAAKFHSMWWNSPGHRNNMMNPNHRVVGVGLVRTSNAWWATHVFGS